MGAKDGFDLELEGVRLMGARLSSDSLADGDTTQLSREVIDREVLLFGGRTGRVEVVVLGG